jgi:hypothetical protein
MSHHHSGAAALDDVTPLFGSIVALAAGWGAAVAEWLAGAGLFNPASLIAFAGTCIGFVANYPKLRAGAPQLWADLKLVCRGIKGEPKP